MQNASHVKTVLERRLPAKKLLVLVVVVLVVLGVVLFRLLNVTSPSQSTCSESYRKDKSLSIGTVVYSAELASDDQAKMEGLGGRKCLPENQAMLFAFPEEDIANRCFWMKDMNFSIDILWLDAQKKIVHLESEVLASSYPKLYCPDVPSQYVVELAAGMAIKNQHAVGSIVNF